ncbi:MAG: hypothetical protein KGS46_08780 [Chloroflexi bacterium]|nr:hypothetical protein [Chloroflexota bacterium]
MSANAYPPVKIELSPPPDFVLALADVIRFIDKKRANANATPPPNIDEPRAERPPTPPTKPQKHIKSK